MLVCPAGVDRPPRLCASSPVSRRTFAGNRARAGRRLSAGRQAPLVLAHLRRGHTYAQAQVLELRSGAGPIPASFKISHTVDAATFTPCTSSSPYTLYSPSWDFRAPGAAPGHVRARLDKRVVLGAVTGRRRVDGPARRPGAAVGRGRAVCRALAYGRGAGPVRVRCERHSGQSTGLARYAFRAELAPYRRPRLWGRRSQPRSHQERA